MASTKLSSYILGQLLLRILLSTAILNAAQPHPNWQRQHFNAHAHPQPGGAGYRPPHPHHQQQQGHGGQAQHIPARRVHSRSPVPPEDEAPIHGPMLLQGVAMVPPPGASMVPPQNLLPPYALHHPQRDSDSEQDLVNSDQPCGESIVLEPQK